MVVEACEGTSLKVSVSGEATGEDSYTVVGEITPATE